MSDNLITVGTYGTAAEAEIVHAALVEEDIPAFVEAGLTATVLPGTAVKLQVPEDQARKARRVLEQVEHRRVHRSPPASRLPGDRMAEHALLLACVALILFPVLILLRASIVVLFETEWNNLLRIQATGPMFAVPVFLSLVSAGFLGVRLWSRADSTEEGRKYARDAWKYDLIVLVTALVCLAGLMLAGGF